MAKTPQADVYLAEVFQKLGLQNVVPMERYERIDEIVAALSEINERVKKTSKDHKGIPAGTTGNISEKLCKLGIPDFLMEARRELGKDWEWLGDVLLPGHPFDIIISVKSFRARERLLASGSGSLLAPTIGWGLFEAPKEWSANRLKSYLYRGFVAIYMPSLTLEQLSSDARKVENINGKQLLRKLHEFPDDLTAATYSRGRLKGRVDIRKL